MGICYEQPRDKIFIAGFHTGPALTPTALCPVNRQWHPLDIATMTDSDDHVFLLDQILIVLIAKLVGNFGAARIGKTLAGGGKLFKHNLIHPGHRTQNIKIIPNTPSQFLCFVGELAAFHSGQTLQA